MFCGGASTTIPAWFSGAAVNAWVNITASALSGSSGVASPALGAPGSGNTGPSARVNAWSAMALKTTGSEIVVMGGGHQDYAGNEVSSIRLGDDAPAWQLRRTFTDNASIVIDSDHYSDGRPSSCHGYYSLQFIDAHNKMHRFGDHVRYSLAGNSGIKHDAFSLVTNDWDAATTWANIGADAANYISVGIPLAIAKESATEDLYAITPTGTRLVKWTRATDSWANLSTVNGTAFSDGPICHDPVRGHVFNLRTTPTTGGALDCAKYSTSTGARTAITFNASAGKTALEALSVFACGMDYCPDRDSYLAYIGTTGKEGVVYEIIPNGTTTWDIAQLTTTGATPATVDGSGLWGRWRYAPALGGFAMLPSYTGTISFLRTG